ncbi:MAG: tyrosine-type recombinase/integrase [Pseudonocardia sp.]|nr:tyrosine-type recombinase/integrase [Pseudonocardia sp.]
MPDASREVYQRAITQLGAWLATEHPDATAVEHLRRRHVDGWMRHLADDLGRSEATRRVRLIALRKFLAYLGSEPDIPLDANPAEHVALPCLRDKVVPIIHERHAASGSPALFLSIRSGDRGGWRISGGGIAEMLSRRCAAVGLPPVHPHMLRHTWANDLLSHGANEDDVEKPAGWRSPLMVRRYGASAASQRARDSARRLARGERV